MEQLFHQDLYTDILFLNHIIYRSSDTLAACIKSQVDKQTSIMFMTEHKLQIKCFGICRFSRSPYESCIFLDKKSSFSRLAEQREGR